MTEIRLVASREVSNGDLVRLRALLDEAFDQEFTDDDWDHALGGWHAIITIDRVPISHAAVVAREIEIGGQLLQGGYFEAVATAPAVQGKGYGSRALRAAMEVVRRKLDIGVLSTSRHRFYERLGWERWKGPSFVLRDGGRVRTADEDDGIMVLRFGVSLEVALSAAIACHARRGDDW